MVQWFKWFDVLKHTCGMTNIPLVYCLVLLAIILAHPQYLHLKITLLGVQANLVINPTYPGGPHEGLASDKFSRPLPCEIPWEVCNPREALGTQDPMGGLGTL